MIRFQRRIVPREKPSGQGEYTGGDGVDLEQENCEDHECDRSDAHDAHGPE